MIAAEAIYFDLPHDARFRFVTATRGAAEGFDQTGLSRSLKLVEYPDVSLRIFHCNSRPLPDVYNEAIEESREDPAILIFCHDDIMISDLFWPEHLWQALCRFDVVGVAGCKRRETGQTAWWLSGPTMSMAGAENLSGRVGHGIGMIPESVGHFGAPHVEVKLLDGLFIAVRSEILHRHNLRFDSRFDFHFYDLDFCRSAEMLGLRMGTCSVSLVHQSEGTSVLGDAWQENRRRYLEKWGG